MRAAPADVDSPSVDRPNQAQLLLDLQRVNKIAQRLSGCLEIEIIASIVTDGLVHQFGCAFARIWVVEPDATMLRLVASSGLYTHTNGSFARVPMGAYKVGKIAQNRVPFLSNRLAEEAWVKDRDWAIANNIQGFAGYPLMTGDRVIGVLATFSHSPMAAEFLEVLQVLCMTATIALDAALQVEAKPTERKISLTNSPTLSDQLAHLLTTATMALVGTETPLPDSVSYIFLRLGELLDEFRCDYARLVYGATDVTLEAIVALPAQFSNAQASQIGSLPHDAVARWRSRCHQLRFMVTCLGGSLQTQPGPQQQMVQVTLQTPYGNRESGDKVSIQCREALVQTALTCLAYRAGLTVCDALEPEAIVITDSETVARAADRVLWVRVKASNPAPAPATASIGWDTDADQLRQVVHQLHTGQWVESAVNPGTPRPSEREREIMALLAQGLRDRDIANQLYISESTVKFHINNSLAKLQAKNRYQAVYQAAVHGWI
ncbi:LuxR C-terminal-related transcriptional regulator [Nodosilinea sp. LEGE 07298]|uniref:LuxR C-terminal-related transcriptional regulator n=1 Tax=Nodosilinea sp. LEGE 07298 TaxID=2777970 RepID=UPI0028BE0536|nr:LuxR C-terminal-related transcriptional regulator [Nodosilinea sp. LEGE 07298]